MHTIHKTDEAFGFIPLPDDAGKPITVVGTDAIRDNFDETCLQQAVNSRMAPGVTDRDPESRRPRRLRRADRLRDGLADAHLSGARSAWISSARCPCSSSTSRRTRSSTRQTRRALINAIVERTPTGAGRGQRSVKKGRHVDRDLGILAVTEGATEARLRSARHPAGVGDALRRLDPPRPRRNLRCPS